MDTIPKIAMGLEKLTWSSPQARAYALARVAQLDRIDESTEFRDQVIDMTIRTVVPFALRAAASMIPTETERLMQAAFQCERDGKTMPAFFAATAAHKTAVISGEFAVDPPVKGEYVRAADAASAAARAAIQAPCVDRAMIWAADAVACAWGASARDAFLLMYMDRVASIATRS